MTPSSMRHTDAGPRKWCPACETLKTPDDFGICKTNYDGKASQCRLCCTRSMRRTNVKRRYGITQEQFEVMWAQQNGCCAICLRPFGESKENCHIDHDHTTGDVRALICRGCNLGLGNFQDDPETLARAAQYVAHYKAASSIASAKTLSYRTRIGGDSGTRVLGEG